MLKEKLKNHNLILASGSPRRHYFFKELDLDFTIDVRPVNEVYDPNLKEAEITDYLSKLKASVFNDLKENDILVTSDTIVWKDGKPIEKARDEAHAKAMLRDLSGAMHEVFTSVCFTGKDFQKVVNDRTKVWFKELTEEEIHYYITTHKPYDKAGSYGVQEWLGYIGIEKLEGSYFNVMGLPTRLVYKTLLELSSN
ncbi:Maf family nucleotide pyrophosphatase [Marinirhabdus gelatinilytica]|uniref:dTTP/UTP pyrophosphatase n=1 Tax=Marinirhabdus gelatinilytica TaxID=1703343 RepID=A0A370QB15_9FLAO|nr:Maf family nucleotide pyrophosphatase [Marinirhabdus gelatinilytica]RDK85566.1 septum formation protein [Marinirhabdus gelatinilytica]